MGSSVLLFCFLTGAVASTLIVAKGTSLAAYYAYVKSSSSPPSSNFQPTGSTTASNANNKPTTGQRGKNTMNDTDAFLLSGERGEIFLSKIQKVANVMSLWKVYKFARALVLPATCMMANWLLLSDKDKVLRIIPSMFSASYYDIYAKENTPLHPQNLVQAFELGALWDQLQREPASEEEVLARASPFVRGRKVSPSELEALPKVVREMVEEEGALGNLKNVLNLATIMWVVSTVGITATVGPATYAILRPFINFGLIAKVTTAILRSLQYPAMLLASMYLSVESVRYHDGLYTQNGVMTALTAQVLFAVPLFMCFDKMFRALDFGPSLSLVLFALNAAPMAILHQSPGLGYLVVVPLIAALGLSNFGNNLCHVLGFNDTRELVKCAFGSGSLIVLYFGLRRLRIDSYYLRPFQQPVAVFGTTVYLLALHIHAYESFYWRRGRARGWQQYGGTVLYLTNLLLLECGGRLNHMPQLATMAEVYMGLTLYTVASDASIRNAPNHLQIVGVFFSFCLLYAGTAFLHSHPTVIQRFIQGSTPPL